MYYDLVNDVIVPSSTIPYAHGGAIAGNRIFIMSTSELIAEELEYLYVMRHTGQEMWRSLVYW
jgi:hypothetical protein